MDTNNASKKQGNTVKLRTATYDRIQALKHTGQSNNGFITELLDLYESDIRKNPGIRSPKRTGKKDD